MNTTSSPSSSTPLNDRTKPYQSSPARSTRSAPSASASSRAKIASSSCSALNPLARRIAFRSHWSPNTRSRAPTASRSAFRGIAVSAGPSAAVIAASATVAAPTPARDERHPRASAEARTIVSASTISTALARKAERTRKALPVLMRPSPSVARAIRDGGGGRDVLRVRQPRLEEQPRARTERNEHEDERPTQSRSSAAEDVIRDGAEEQRSESHRERAKQRSHRLGAAPEGGRHDVELARRDRRVLEREEQRRGDEVGEGRERAPGDERREEQDRRGSGADGGDEDASVQQASAQ